LIHLHQDGLSKALENPLGRFLSLGAGVQSSVLALASARGDLPKLDGAIFADTGWEPAKVYEWLAWLETQVPFPIIRVRREGLDLGDYSLAVARGEITDSKMTPPWFTKDPDGFLMKTCNKEFKTRLITAYLRGLLGLKPRERGPADPTFEVWMGISMDERWRMKSAEQKFMHNRFVLIEARMNRQDCITYCEDRQIPRPPKSSCIFCPYRTNSQWVDMRDNEPEEFARVVEFDHGIRPGFAGMEGTAYIHRQRVPLGEANLDNDDDPQGKLFGFENDCEGVCGL